MSHEMERFLFKIHYPTSIRIKIYHHFRLSQEGQYASISMVNICKYFTADRKRNYKYPLSGWSKTAKGWSYGGSAICPLILIPF